MPKPSLDFLSMSDEDFAKLSPEDAASSAPTSTPAAETPPAEEELETETPATEDGQGTQTGEVAEETTEEQPEAEPPATTNEPPPPEVPEKKEGEAPPATEVPATETKPEEKPTEEPPAAEKEKKPESTPVDYKAFYERMMAPFKANGRFIQLESPDEAIALMQMGANYTKKMQSIQPNKKYLLMLENNGLLDEGKLSLLIDLHNKNPEAIKQYLKDAKIDPVDLDTSGEINYRRGSHAVTDQEAALSTTIEDVSSMAHGKETLQSVQAWDYASRQELLKTPELLSLIREQHENGIYAKVVTEIERRKILGQVSTNTPFLHAYKIVGDELARKGAFQSAAKPATPAPAPVARTPVAVRPAVKNPPTKAPDNRVRAAAPTRSSPRTTRPAIDILAMSDEDFLKLEGKV